MVLHPGEADRSTSVDESGRKRQIRLAAVASVVGTSIEWYDFFLYGTAAAIAGRARSPFGPLKTLVARCFLT